MASRVKMTLRLNPAAQILKDHGLDVDGRAQKFLSSEVRRLCDPYVPFDTGTLKNTAEVGQTYVDYITPYAHRQYYHHRGNGLRGPHWEKRMMADKGSQLVASVARYCGGTVR